VTADAERVRPAASEVLALVADATRARDRLGWAPKHSLDDGLRATIDWIRHHPDAYRPREYAV
jgi:nucleoside-diphosphate-sugar epimerase